MVFASLSFSRLSALRSVCGWVELSGGKKLLNGFQPAIEASSDGALTLNDNLRWQWVPAAYNSEGEEMLTQAGATSRLVFVPSCCCLHIHFQQSVVDTAQIMVYIIYMLHVYTLSHTLHSSSDICMLEIQRYKRKTCGFRSFPCFGPHIWNSLPQDPRHCSTLSSFKAKLKTFLFSQYLHPN